MHETRRTLKEGERAERELGPASRWWREMIIIILAILLVLSLSLLVVNKYFIVNGSKDAEQIIVIPEANGEAFDGMLPSDRPNQYVESVGLSRQLDPGSYTATAYFTAIHPDTNAYMGEVAAEIKITVQ